MADAPASSMRALVIGGTGFIGGHLARALRHRGHEVVATSRGDAADVELDVSDGAACRALVTTGRFDVVVNLAGVGVTAGEASGEEMVAVNEHGPVHVAEACFGGRSPVRLVHVASSTEPLDGTSAESRYSSTKAAGTRAVLAMGEKRGVPVTVARVHNTYGCDQPRGRFVVDLVEAISRGGVFVIRHPHRIRDFCFIDDVTDHLTAVAEAGTSPQLGVEIGTGVGTSLMEMANVVLERFGGERDQVRYEQSGVTDPAPTCVAGTAPGRHLVCSTTVEEGLRRMAEEIG